MTPSKVYLWIGSFLRPYSPYVILFLVLCFLASFMQLSLPYFVGKLIDKVIPERNVQLFFILLITVLFLYLLGCIVQMGKNKFALFYQEYPARDLQLSVFRHIRELGFSYYERNTVGETLALIQSDVADVQRLYKEFIPNFTQTMIMFVVYFTYLIYISASLSMILIVSFALYYLVGPYLEKKAAKLGTESIRIRNNAQAMNYNAIASIVELKASAAEDFFLKKIMDKFSLFNNTNILFMIYENAKGGVRRIFVYFGSAFLFFFGFILVKNNSITTGEFMVFVVIYTRVMLELTRLITQITEQRILYYQALKIYNLCVTPSITYEDEENVVNGGCSPLSGKIEFIDVSFGYSPEKMILNNLSFTINPGEHVAIVSKSGGGKSTIVKLISRFYDVDSGEIRIDDVPVKKISLHHLREHVTYAFQDTILFHASIQENIKFARPEALEDEIFEAARLANVHEFASKLPDGYKTLIGDKGNKLSGGQKQRIALARVLLKNSPIIILDETTSALDNVNEAIVNKNLKLMREKTIITIAHRPATMRSCDRILVLDQGKIVEQGSYEELLNIRGCFSEIIAGEGLTNE